MVYQADGSYWFHQNDGTLKHLFSNLFYKYEKRHQRTLWLFWMTLINIFQMPLYWNNFRDLKRSIIEKYAFCCSHSSYAHSRQIASINQKSALEPPNIHIFPKSWHEKLPLSYDIISSLENRGSFICVKNEGCIFWNSGVLWYWKSTFCCPVWMFLANIMNCIVAYITCSGSALQSYCRMCG